MAIFNSYVKLPEDNPTMPPGQSDHRIGWAEALLVPLARMRCVGFRGDSLDDFTKTAGFDHRLYDVT